MAIGLALTGLVAFYIASNPTLLNFIFRNQILFFGLIELVDGVLSAGNADASVVGIERFGDGVRGKATVVDPQTLLSYAFQGNCVPDEGTIMTWVKPEWRQER